MTPSRVRAYAPADAGALALIFHRAVQEGAATVYDQAQRDGWSPALIETAAYARRLDGLRTLVAVDAAGRPIGFLTFDPADHIDLLFVAPERIGSGVAFALYRAAVAEARARGIARLTVEASAQSHAFFLRQGWHETGERIVRGQGAAAIENRMLARDVTPD